MAGTNGPRTDGDSRYREKHQDGSTLHAGYELSKLSTGFTRRTRVVVERRPPDGMREALMRSDFYLQWVRQHKESKGLIFNRQTTLFYRMSTCSVNVSSAQLNDLVNLDPLS